VDLDLARQQWEDGNRRIEAARSDPSRYISLAAQVDIVVAGLRERVGQIFTLDELAQAYDGADEWARTLLDDADPDGGPSHEPGTVADAAFHAYARGAADYRP
jgi:hypothetical protein